MSQTSNLHHCHHACEECDLLVDIPTVIPHRTKVFCPRCHHSLAVGHRNPRQHILALSITSWLLMLVACSLSFISFSASGQQRTINLLQTTTELYAQGHYFVSFLVAIFIIILPLFYLSLLMIIIINTYIKLPFLNIVLLGKLMSFVLPWSMAEVFLIGVLIALIKVIAMADVVMEISFWAYAGFAPLFAYIVAIVDKHRLWGWIDYEK